MERSRESSSAGAPARSTGGTNAVRGAFRTDPDRTLMSGEGLSYAAAGVDIEAYERVLEKVSPLIEATHGPEGSRGGGPFAGLSSLSGGGHFAASAHGVGTKIKVATAASLPSGIGTDLAKH